MKSCVIVFLFSFIIACNAEVNYLDVAKKVVDKLLNYNTLFNKIFDRSFGYTKMEYEITETKVYGWNRLEVEESSVQGLQLTRDTHDVQFVIRLPSPIIKGKLSYKISGSTFSSPITAISSCDMKFMITIRINEYYSETVWKSFFLTHSLENNFVSQFDCNIFDISNCVDVTELIDGKLGPWNQPSKLVNHVQRILLSIRYF